MARTKIRPPLRADTAPWLARIVNQVFDREWARTGAFIYVPLAMTARSGPVTAGDVHEYEKGNAEASRHGLTQWPKLVEVIPWIDALGHDHRDVMSVQLMKTARSGYAYEIELIKILRPPRKAENGEVAHVKVTHVVGADEMFPEMVPHR